jgi:hypothetical protein
MAIAVAKLQLAILANGLFFCWQNACFSAFLAFNIFLGVAILFGSIPHQPPALPPLIRRANWSHRDDQIHVRSVIGYKELFCDYDLLLMVKSERGIFMSSGPAACAAAIGSGLNPPGYGKIPANRSASTLGWSSGSFNLSASLHRSPISSA